MAEEKEQMVYIYNVNIVTEQDVVRNGCISFNRSGIQEIMSEEVWDKAAAKPDAVIIDGEDGWVLPGFIDIHVHGALGRNFMEANKQSFDAITQYHAKHGTTAMLATTTTASKSHIDGVLQGATEYMGAAAGMPFARIIGVHLEGPFFCDEYKGAQLPEYIVPPNLEWVKEWGDRYRGVVRILTLAPEMEGAGEVIEWCASNGIVPACGHSGATYDVMQEARSKGLKHSVHMFNGMKGLHHREPGTAGAILADDGISAEIIADGHHVHPGVIRMLASVKRNNNLIMITDAVEAAGLADGLYTYEKEQIHVENGVVRLVGSGSLAGSSLTMDKAFRYMTQTVGLDPAEVSRMASGNPAKLLGLSEQLGAIKQGFPSDIVWMNNEFMLREVWIAGRKMDRT